MKCRTSFFNASVLRKDLTRFASLWGLYTIAMLLFHIITANGYGEAKYFAQQIGSEVSGMAPVVCLYAGVCAVVLFGDLYVPRMCNALHGMPMRREGWFLTHTAAGLLFGLIPHVLTAAVIAFQLGEYRFLTWSWLGSVMLQYVFFFGLGCFCALCAGHWLGMAAVYGIANFGAAMVFVLLDGLYLPLLPGVVLTAETFEDLWPLFRILEHPVLETVMREEVLHVKVFGEAWCGLAVLAAAGVGFAGLAVVLYRRRHLERAGDFLAVKALEPVFLGIAALGAGGFLYLFADLLFSQSNRIFLFVGMAIGYFVGLMLLRHSTRVFRPKTILCCGSLLAAMALSLAVTALDPLGIVTRVPAEDQIASCTLDFRYRFDSRALTDPAQIHEVVQIHEAVCRLEPPREDRPYELGITPIRISYELTDGSVIRREYTVDNSTEVGKRAASLLYSWQSLLGTDDLEEFARRITAASVSLYSEEWYYVDVSPSDYGMLLEAIAADADAGLLCPAYTRSQTEPILGSVDLEFVTPEGNWSHSTIEVPASAVRILEVIRQLEHQ